MKEKIPNNLEVGERIRSIREDLNRFKSYLLSIKTGF